MRVWVLCWDEREHKRNQRLIYIFFPLCSCASGLQARGESNYMAGSIVGINWYKSPDSSL